jgi:hypothetical protein
MANTPNTKGKPMSTTTLTVTKVTQAQAKSGQATVAKAKADGELSNRTNTARMAGIVSAVLAIIATGKAVEITDLFPAVDPITGKPNTAPAYHLAHRALSANLVRPNWHKVIVVPIVTSTAKVAKPTKASTSVTAFTITGDTSTTAKVGTVRLFLAPAK